MQKKENTKYLFPLQEVLNMEIMINQALIDILIEKGIITPAELMAKIDEIQQEMPKGSC